MGREVKDTEAEKQSRPVPITVPEVSPKYPTAIWQEWQGVGWGCGCGHGFRDHGSAQLSQDWTALAAPHSLIGAPVGL